jgi:hypothetical protein
MGSGFPSRTGVVAAAVALLALMFCLAGGAALGESVTSDEVAHIGAGVSYAHKLDMRLNEEHPPLVKMLAALPLLARGTRADYSNAAWVNSADFEQASLGEWVFGDYLLTRWNDAAGTLAWARFPMLLLTVALGWTIFALSRRLGGDWGGLLCLAVYCGNPVFLAFGPLVITDIAIALFFLLTLWAMAGMWNQPDRKHTLVLALALAGALLSKFTAPLLFLVFLALAISRRGSGTGQRWRAMGRATLWAGLIVYATYFLLSWNQPVDIPFLAGHGRAADILGRLLMPPWLVLRGVAWVVITGNRPTFLLGQAYPHGVWFYFPVVLVLKSAPGFVGLLVLAAGLVAAGRRLAVPAEYTTHWRVLWLGLIVFLGICLLSRMNIGIRHFSVPLVLLILMLAPLPRLLGRVPNVAGSAAVGLLAASCLVTAIRAYPFYVPYVAPLVPGYPAYWLVNDSNLDWNQGLPEAASFARRRNLKDVPLDMYGFSGATLHLPQSRHWDCQAPSATDAGLWAVVSANMILDAHNCAWLMNYPYEPLAGGSMYAVRLPPVIPEAGSPAGPPAPGARQIFLRMPFDIRQVLQDLVRRPEDLPRALEQVKSGRYEKRD